MLQVWRSVSALLYQKFHIVALERQLQEQHIFVHCLQVTHQMGYALNVVYLNGNTQVLRN